MKCDEAEVLLHALIDGELDAGHAREVEEHVATCPHCAAALRDYREMSKAVAEAGVRYKASLELRKRIEAALPQPRQVPAGDVTGFVREHADHLVWNLGVNQRSGVDEDSLGIDHKGVERAVVDDGDLNVLLREAGGAQDGLRVVAQQLFDLGVADHGKSGRQALRARRCRRDGHCRRNRDRECRQQRKRMRGWRPPPHPDSASAVDHVRSNREPNLSQPSGAPKQGQREP